MPAALGAAAVALLTLLALAGPADAHAALVRSDPADGATVSAAPSAVTLTFDEAMATPAVVVVTDARGRRSDRGAVRVSGPTVSVPVSLPEPGRYTVAFRVVSADGHPVSDQFSFAFVPPGATAPPAAPSTGASAGGTQDASLLRTVGVIGLGLLLTLVLGVGLVRALRANQHAPDAAQRRAAERAAASSQDRP